MFLSTYIDGHPLRDAFLANRLDRLAGLIVEQGDDMLASAGLSFPSRAVSTVMLIGERRRISAAEIARELGQAHQLVTQRLQLLIQRKIVRRLNDPSDARRKQLALTSRGERELERLLEAVQQTDEAMKRLFEEIECDLAVAALRAMEALGEHPIADRVGLPRKRAGTPRANARSTGRRKR